MESIKFNAKGHSVEFSKRTLTIDHEVYSYTGISQVKHSSAYKAFLFRYKGEWVKLFYEDPQQGKTIAALFKRINAMNARRAMQARATQSIDTAAIAAALAGEDVTTEKKPVVDVAKVVESEKPLEAEAVAEKPVGAKAEAEAVEPKVEAEVEKPAEVVAEKPAEVEAKAEEKPAKKPAEKPVKEKKPKFWSRKKKAAEAEKKPAEKPVEEPKAEAEAEKPVEVEKPAEPAVAEAVAEEPKVEPVAVEVPEEPATVEAPAIEVPEVAEPKLELPEAEEAAAEIPAEVSAEEAPAEAAEVAETAESEKPAEAAVEAENPEESAKAEEPAAETAEDAAKAEEAALKKSRLKKALTIFAIIIALFVIAGIIYFFTIGTTNDSSQTINTDETYQYNDIDELIEEMQE